MQFDVASKQTARQLTLAVQVQGLIGELILIEPEQRLPKGCEIRVDLDLSMGEDMFACDKTMACIVAEV